GDIARYDAWFMSHLAAFDATRADGTRFIDVYTETGGTAANSRAMAGDATTWLGGAGLAASILDDDTPDTLTPDQYSFPVIFKLSMLSHDGVPRYYFQRLAQASGFTPL